MEVIPAQENDLEEILQLQYLAYKSEAILCDDYSIPPLQQTIEGIVEEATISRFLVVKFNDVIIGSVRAYMDEGVCKIGRLIVHPEHQRKGVGTTLIANIEMCFPGASTYEVFTGKRSEGNLRLYNKLEYKLYKEEKLNERITLVFLRKEN